MKNIAPTDAAAQEAVETREWIDSIDYVILVVFLHSTVWPYQPGMHLPNLATVGQIHFIGFRILSAFSQENADGIGGQGVGRMGRWGLV